jgi:hypothetical protein
MPRHVTTARPRRGRQPALHTAFPSQPRAPITLGPDPGTGWEADPVLAQIRATQQQNAASAEAAAAAARQQALIQFGYSPELAGLYGDQNTARAAQQDPFSVLANLAHQHQLRLTNLNESYNKANLFYSGHRGQALGEEGRQYLGEQASAQQQLQSTLSQLQQNLLSARQASTANINQAQTDAYNRWLQQQASLGYPAQPKQRTAPSTRRTVRRQQP